MEVQKTMSKFPKVSIIIAVYNGRKTIDACLNSIREQTYPNIELIVMDGNSSDGTQQILSTYSNQIDYWESEADRGIYHAWNKGISHATGDWITFIGADDVFAYKTVIQEMIDISQGCSCNFISGRFRVLMNSGDVEKGDLWDLEKMRKWQTIAHPGSLHHKALFEQYGLFNEKYKIAGDYDFLLRAENSVRGCYVDKVLVLMGGEGISNVQALKVLYETFNIQREHKQIGLFYALYNFMIAYVKLLIRRIK